MSARNEEDICRLAEKIKKTLYGDFVNCEFLFPYDKGGLVSAVIQNSEVIAQNYVENGVHLVVNCHQNDVAKYREYILVREGE